MSFPPSTHPPPLTPTTTLQEDITLAGQRRINIIWEVTQAVIAVFVVCGNIGLGVYTVISARDVKVPEAMSNALFLIVGFYFSRTNHAAIGGTGRKTETKYEGR